MHSHLACALDTVRVGKLLWLESIGHLPQWTRCKACAVWNLTNLCSGLPPHCGSHGMTCSAFTFNALTNDKSWTACNPSRRRTTHGTRPPVLVWQKGDARQVQKAAHQCGGRWTHSVSLALSVCLSTQKIDSGFLSLQVPHWWTEQWQFAGSTADCAVPTIHSSQAKQHLEHLLRGFMPPLSS